MKTESKTIWTIGHSTHPFDEFVALLRSFKIELIADIRSYPGSRRFPQYNKAALEVSLPEENIQYIHLKNLGGRRKAAPDSKNTAWRDIAFRGYADYMETGAFRTGIQELETLASKQRRQVQAGCRRCRPDRPRQSQGLTGQSARSRWQPR